MLMHSTAYRLMAVYPVKESVLAWVGSFAVLFAGLVFTRRPPDRVGFLLHFSSLSLTFCLFWFNLIDSLITSEHSLQFSAVECVLCHFHSCSVHFCCCFCTRTSSTTASIWCNASIGALVPLFTMPMCTAYDTFTCTLTQTHTHEHAQSLNGTEIIKNWFH